MFKHLAISVSFFALIGGLYYRSTLFSTDELEELDIPDPLDPSGVDRRKAQISKNGFQFAPFRVEGPGLDLSTAEAPDDEELMLVERGNEKILLRVVQLAYHHVAQGMLGGQPFAVCF